MKRFTSTILALALSASLAPAVQAAPTVTGTGSLLSDPFLQLPEVGSVNVVWFTNTPGATHAIVTGDVDKLTADNAADAATANVDGVEVFAADTMKLSRMAEDAESFVDNAPAESEGIVARDVYRHEGTITGMHPTERMPYRVISIDGGDVAMSEVFSAADKFESGEGVSFLLTSDHQEKKNAPANLQYAAQTIAEQGGPIDVALVAGDLVNVPDRASEWFDHNNGLAFFQGMQGNAEFINPESETVFNGGEIAQNAHVYPVIGNHEVMGRVDGRTNMTHAFNNPVPREVAEAEYEKVAAEVNPTGDAAVKDKWIEDNSFSTRSYEEIFSLPESSAGGEKYYATSIGNTRLISLYSTRIWRGTDAVEDPAARDKTSRYHESADVLDQPLERGYGDFIFEDLAVDSAQYNWLEQELASPETAEAEHVIVMLHESPHSLGNNAMPHFSHPVESVEKDEEGNVVGITYEYPEEGNILLNSLMPLVDKPGTPVDLVFNGHSHLWNRFQSDNGVNFIETSNVGNSYGARHEDSTNGPRPVPAKDSQYWDPKDYMEYGSPGGLEPIVPTIKPLEGQTLSGEPAPWVASNQYSVFTGFDSETGMVRSWIFDGDAAEPTVELLDEFSLSDTPVDEPQDDTDKDQPTPGGSANGSSLGGALAVLIGLMAAVLGGGFFAVQNGLIQLPPQIRALLS